VPYNARVSAEKLADPILIGAAGREVLLVDDSSVSLAQLTETLSQLDVKIHTASNGLMGLRTLRQWADEGHDLNQKLLIVFTDAKMLEMDADHLTAESRDDPRMKDMYVVTHSSLSGSSNWAIVKKVGCDNYPSKFQPERLIDVNRDRLQRDA